MAAIFADDSAHLRARVAAARVLARLCTGDIKSQAQTFIVATYEDRLRAARTEIGPPHYGTTLEWVEVYPGLADADIPEATAILMSELRAIDGPSAKALSGRADGLLAQTRLRQTEARLPSALPSERLWQGLVERAERLQAQARRNENGR